MRRPISNDVRRRGLEASAIAVIVAYLGLVITMIDALRRIVWGP